MIKRFMWLVGNLFKNYTKEERELIKKNKKLVKEFPFLLPRNRLTGKIAFDYNYTWTELDSMPKGWRDVFGIEMSQNIKTVLRQANYVNKYRITQIKEKYGTLRWYDAGVPESIHSEFYSVIDYYEDKSMLVCLNCGKKTDYVTTGWTEYLCEDCLKDIQNKFPNLTYFELTWSHIPERTFLTSDDRVVHKESQLKGDMMVNWKRYSKHNNSITYYSRHDDIETKEENTLKAKQLW